MSHRHLFFLSKIIKNNTHSQCVFNKKNNPITTITAIAPIIAIASIAPIVAIAAIVTISRKAPRSRQSRPAQRSAYNPKCRKRKYATPYKKIPPPLAYLKTNHYLCIDIDRVAFLVT